MELKADKGCADLRALAKTALRQMEERKYDTEMHTKGINDIFKYGVAFRGKEVEIEIA